MEEAEEWHGPGSAVSEASAAITSGDRVRLLAALTVCDRLDPGVRLRAVAHAMLREDWELARWAATGLPGSPLHDAIKLALDRLTGCAAAADEALGRMSLDGGGG